MTMIAAKLKQAGYATHYTGKWDAGFATRYHLPVNRGFDTGFGYLQHANDYWQFTAGCAYDLWNNTHPGVGDTNPKSCSQTDQTGCNYEDDMFVAHVLDELDAHDASQPLFYYWAMHNVHEPLEVPQSYIDKFTFIPDIQRRRYSAMVNHMDDMVGKVIAKLRAKGMWDNTLIVFSSDNGGPVYAGGGANNFPLKGGKMSNWEGGIRVNAFVSGGLVPANLRGTKSEQFITIGDWYATFSTLAGVDPTDVSAAKDMWPLLTGTNKTNPRTEIPIGQDNGGNGNNITVQGIIVPPYKLLIDEIGTSFWQGPLYPNATTNFADQSKMVTRCGLNGCLFNIITDPSEHNDISAQNPSVVARLQDRINYYQKTVFNVDRGAIDPNVCSIADNKYQGFFGPFVDPTFH